MIVYIYKEIVKKAMINTDKRTKGNGMMENSKLENNNTENIEDVKTENEVISKRLLKRI